MRSGPIVLGVICVIIGVPIALNIFGTAADTSDFLRRHYFRDDQIWSKSDWRVVRRLAQVAGVLMGAFGLVAIVIGFLS
jgi:hypothetical protein